VARSGLSEDRTTTDTIDSDGIDRDGERVRHPTTPVSRVAPAAPAPATRVPAGSAPVASGPAASVPAVSTSRVTARSTPVSPASVSPPPAAPAPAPAAPTVGRTHTSVLATVGVIVGLTGMAAALTGRLAPFGIALGLLGGLFSFGGAAMGARPRVTGRGLGSFGLLVGVASIVLSALALAHATSWLDSNVDQVAAFRNWVNLQLPWMRNW
jgi:hypothetical protein